MSEDREELDGNIAGVWCRRIEEAREWDRAWRERVAPSAEKQYRVEAARDFPILRANVDTIRPHLLSAPPIPDIRYREGFAEDEAVRIGAAVVERVLAVALDDSAMRELLAAVTDMLVVGRGVARVLYEPVLSDGHLIDQRVRVRHVPWRRFIVSPSECWRDVAWVAFEHHMTRAEIGAQFGEDARRQVSTDAADGGSEQRDKKAREGRVRVWEVWDKAKRQVVFAAPSYRDAPLLVADDPLRLEGFFPVAEPLCSSVDGGTLIPIPDIETYATQAGELAALSKRINGLIPGIRYRGIRAADLPELDLAMEGPDGQFVAADSAVTIAQMTGGGLERAIWAVPIRDLVDTVTALHAQREAVKQAVYEISGVADVVRGASDPRETLGAQQIKAQYAGSRLAERQRQVAGWCRDLVRIMAEVVTEHFEPEILAGVAGIPQAAVAVQPLGDDVRRRWMVDIETDSTVQGDAARLQSNIGNFLAGFAQAVQALGPVVQSGVMPAAAAASMLKAFSRPFRLGRSVDEALSTLGQQQQQQPQPQDQKVVADQKRAELDMQVAAAEHAMRMEELAAQAEIARERHRVELAKLRNEAAIAVAANMVPV